MTALVCQGKIRYRDRVAALFALTETRGRDHRRVKAERAGVPVSGVPGMAPHLAGEAAVTARPVRGPSNTVGAVLAAVIAAAGQAKREKP